MLKWCIQGLVRDAEHREGGWHRGLEESERTCWRTREAEGLPEDTRKRIIAAPLGVWGDSHRWQRSGTEPREAISKGRRVQNSVFKDECMGCDKGAGQVPL